MQLASYQLGCSQFSLKRKEASEETAARTEQQITSAALPRTAAPHQVLLHTAVAAPDTENSQQFKAMFTSGTCRIAGHCHMQAQPQSAVFWQSSALHNKSRNVASVAATDCMVHSSTELWDCLSINARQWQSQSVVHGRPNLGRIRQLACCIGVIGSPNVRHIDSGHVLIL